MEQKTIITEADLMQWGDWAIEDSSDQRSLGRELLAYVWQRLGDIETHEPVLHEGYWVTLRLVLKNRCETDFDVDWDLDRIMEQIKEKARERWDQKS